ncbi:phage tail protein [Cloacibacillus sp. An23]|uniref:phage tail protein n=1 Tax=Cloacibacillus sp. An23 TaxID=1965591 RepID=UPI000B36AED3|nr:phage tail protein [Cloacibacillus sp. An23]OUO94822.1 hypothetical protein B5F39_02840 [Cloacibacillus sp. An23]
MAYYSTYMQNENGEMQKVVINAGVGFVLPYYGETAPPGTLACDGSEVSREAYKELFAVLGTKAGAGDGVSTFNLPDMRGRWLAGADAERTAGASIAEGLPDLYGSLIFRPLASGTYPNIVYAALVNLGSSGVFTKSDAAENPGCWSSAVAIGLSAPSSAGNAIGGEVVRFHAQNANPIYGASQNVTPASVAVLWCIIYE